MANGDTVEIKAIETVYKGYRFRSRLEARWAVFYDTLGIEWHYEHEGFELPSGWYLPDFFLPTYQTWIEIKGEEPAHHELILANELRRGLNQHVLVVSGNVGFPDCDDYGVPYVYGEKPNHNIQLFPGHFDNDKWPYTHDRCHVEHSLIDRWQSLRVLLRQHGCRSKPFDSTWDSVDALIELDRVYYRGRYGIEHPRWTYGPREQQIEFAWFSDLTIGFTYGWPYQSEIINAMNAARGARFEHGETP